MATLRFQVGAVVTPGDRLGSARHLSPGVGTYSRGGHVFSCSVGRLCVAEPENDITNGDNNASPSSTVVSVQSSSKQPATHQVLRVGQLVLCRVTRIQLQQASVEIMGAEKVHRLQHQPQGQIRREDVRQNATDELLLESCFRPGDVLLGRILSLGDAFRYLISTAETELGVVRACSSQNSNVTMKAIGWKEMECPVTGRKEPRKVAKPSAALQDILRGL